jgi:hypothetical protein
MPSRPPEGSGAFRLRGVGCIVCVVDAGRVSVRGAGRQTPQSWSVACPTMITVPGWKACCVLLSEEWALGSRLWWAAVSLGSGSGSGCLFLDDVVEFVEGGPDQVC